MTALQISTGGTQLQLQSNREHIVLCLLQQLCLELFGEGGDKEINQTPENGLVANTIPLLSQI